MRRDSTHKQERMSSLDINAQFQQRIMTWFLYKKLRNECTPTTKAKKETVIQNTAS